MVCDNILLLPHLNHNPRDRKNIAMVRRVYGAAVLVMGPLAVLFAIDGFGGFQTVGYKTVRVREQ